MISETSRLIRPPHHELITQIEGEDDFKKFLAENFLYTFQPGFIENCISQLENTGIHRLINKHYLRLFSRIALMAAEYGLQESSGIIMRQFEKRTDREDPYDPLNLILQGIYLANINIQSFDYKKRAAAELPNRETEIWSKYVRSEKGVVNLPDHLDTFLAKTDDTDKYPVRNLRYLKGLPIFIPDIAFHQKVSNIGLTPEIIDSLGVDKVRKLYCPAIENAFAVYLDVRAVLFHPLEIDKVNNNWFD